MPGTLKAPEVFGFLTPDQVNAISENSAKTRFIDGETIYQKGDPARDFFIVLDGEVTLRLPGGKGLSVVIDQLERGDVFGGPVGPGRSSYALTATSTGESSVLRIKAAAMKSLMEADERMGFHLQAHISNAYFNRYLDTMQKLQAIVMNIPIESA